MRLVLLTLILLAASGIGQANEPGRDPAVSRAITFLAREVPRWSAENHCYSCHHNGDAARALYAGLRVEGHTPNAALADTSLWLRSPEKWDHNGGEGPFSDKRLARIQFTAALASAYEAGVVKNIAPLREAATRLARDQADNGSWPLDDVELDGPGTPASYGLGLATHMARESLRTADPIRYREPIEHAGRWLASRELRTIGDASVMLLAFGNDRTNLPASKREVCLALLRQGQSDDGGWGPFVASPPENFDTALAILGLTRIELGPEDRRLIERGRAFLIERQRPDGSWSETTRPAGGESYAQRISTCGWATLALIASGKTSPGGGPDSKR